MAYETVLSTSCQYMENNTCYYRNKSDVDNIGLYIVQVVGIFCIIVINLAVMVPIVSVLHYNNGLTTKCIFSCHSCS